MSFFRFAILIVMTGFMTDSCTLFNDDTDNSLGEGTRYSYVAYDSQDIPVVRGWFTLQIDSTDIKGKWDFEEIGSARNIGPQTGKGDLAGSLVGNEIFIQLNPNFADNNVGLQGVLKSEKIEGRWEWTTLIGPTNSGKFISKKF